MPLARGLSFGVLLVALCSAVAAGPSQSTPDADEVEEELVQERTLGGPEGVTRRIDDATSARSPSEVFGVITSLGGERGWLTWPFAWGVRGLIDKLVGGPGLRRGRRHPTELLQGEPLDSCSPQSC